MPKNKLPQLEDELRQGDVQGMKKFGEILVGYAKKDPRDIVFRQLMNRIEGALHEYIITRALEDRS